MKIVEKIIHKHKEELSKIKEQIIIDFENYLKEIEQNYEIPNVSILNIRNESDIKNAYYGEGFYVILTNYNFPENKCTFSINNHSAIYRGHSYHTKKRLLSHLSNDYYKENKGSTNFEVCLKLLENNYGVNINKEPYKNWEWTILIIKMKGSNLIIREQIEKAFDNQYSKPCKSIN